MYTPHQIAQAFSMTADDMADPDRRIAAMLTALRAEKQRGISGHWTYDNGRHAAMIAIYRAERAAR